MAGSVGLQAAARVVLHGAGPAGFFTAFRWWYLAASALLVGGVGGLLYWYYGRRARTDGDSGDGSSST